jgi:hypothetical protein
MAMNCSAVSRIFSIPFAGVRQGKVLAEQIRLNSSITRRNSYQISTAFSYQLTVLLNKNSYLSLRALKHTSKFSRGKGEKVVVEDEEDEDEENASINISV